MTSGAILAGGHSTRFGDTDKSVAELGGVPMVRRVADRLLGTVEPMPPGAAHASDGTSVVTDLVISCRPEQQPLIATALEGVGDEDGTAVPVRWALDREPDQGPVAGIRNACQTASDNVLVVVACDMPFVDPAFLASLVADLDGVGDAATGGRQPYDAVIPKLDDQWLQTTQAAYRSDPMETACARALARGDRKLTAPLEEIHYRIVDDETVRSRTTTQTFTNVNTPTQRRAAESRILSAETAMRNGDHDVENDQ